MTAEQCLNQWAFEIPPEPIPDKNIIETVSSDVVFVGGGTAGFVTAVSAQESGLSVTLVAASTKPINRGGSNFAVYGKIMEKYGVERCDPWQLQKEIAMAYDAVDQKMWYKVYNKSEESMNWLVDIAAEYGIDAELECDSNLEKDDIYHASMGSHSFIDDEMKQVGMGQ